MSSNDFKAKYIAIKSNIESYNKRIRFEKAKKVSSSYMKGVFVLAAVFLAIFYYLLGKKRIPFNYNASINWLPIILYIAVIMIYAGNTRILTTSQKTAIRVSWLRPYISAVLYPSLVYFKKAPENITAIMGTIYPECEVNYFGCLGNEIMKLYEIACFRKEKNIFTGIVVFASQQHITEHSVSEVTKEYLEIGGPGVEWKNRENYSMMLLPGASMDNMFRDISDCIEEQALELSYNLINCITGVVSKSAKSA